MECLWIFPNPSRNLLKICFNSPNECLVTVKLYDVSGRLVEKQKIVKTEIGSNEILLMPEVLSSGIYFVRLESGNYQKIEKIIYLK